MISSSYTDLFKKCLDKVNSLDYSNITISSLTDISNAINDCLKICKDDEYVYPQFFRLLDEGDNSLNYMKDLLNLKDLPNVADKINDKDLDKVCQALKCIGESYFSIDDNVIDDVVLMGNDVDNYPELYDLLVDVYKSEPSDIEDKFNNFNNELNNCLNDCEGKIDYNDNDSFTLELLRSIGKSHDPNKIRLGVNLFKKDIEKLVFKLDDYLYGLYYIMKQFEHKLKVLVFSDRGVYVVDLDNLDSLQAVCNLPDESEVLSIAILMDEVLYLFNDYIDFVNVTNEDLINKMIGTIVHKFHFDFKNNLIINGVKYDSRVKDLVPIEIIYKKEV